MFKHNFKLALKHSLVLRQWICGNLQKLEYDNEDGTSIQLTCYKGVNEIKVDNCFDANDDETIELLKMLREQKRATINVIVIFHEPLRFTEIIEGPPLPHGFIKNHDTKSIQFGYHSFGIRYDHHFSQGVRQREIYFEAESTATLKEIGDKLKYSDKLKDLITTQSSFHFYGIKQNSHCHFPLLDDEENVILASVWNPYVMLIFSNTK